jgi:hypothetical protein
MPLVTDAEVKSQIKTDIDTTLAIQQADMIVTENLSGKGHSATRLKFIELNLACHFVALAEERGGLKVSKTGDTLETYAGDYTTGLNLTRFGQQAIVLDNSGTLSAGADPSKKAALFAVVGPPPSTAVVLTSAEES